MTPWQQIILQLSSVASVPQKQGSALTLYVVILFSITILNIDTLITDCINAAGNAVASIRVFVRLSILFPVYVLNRLTVNPELLHDHRRLMVKLMITLIESVLPQSRAVFLVLSLESVKLSSSH